MKLKRMLIDGVEGKHIQTHQSDIIQIVDHHPSFKHHQ